MRGTGKCTTPGTIVRSFRLLMRVAVSSRTRIGSEIQGGSVGRRRGLEGV